MWLADLDKLQAMAEAYERDPGQAYTEKQATTSYLLIRLCVFVLFLC